MAEAMPTGLSEAEAASRLATQGPNALPHPGRRNLLAIVQETLREPLFLLLLAAAALYVVIGDLAEGVFLSLAALLSIGLVILQEARSETALAALRDLTRPQARVMRDGEIRLVPAAAIVPGDVILIGEGDRMPADGVLRAGDALRVDESALTGESAPVTKRHAHAGEALGPAAAPGEALSPFLFSGTLVTSGQGVVEVERTGPASSLGRIGVSLAAVRAEQTPLQKTAGRLLFWLSLLALAFCGLVVLAYGVLRGDWIAGALTGITVAIALIPEEFPMVLAVFLALGAWRMAGHRVLVRRSAAIETLGGATVLCVDKTGTLTENRMALARLWSPSTGAVAAQDRPRPPAAGDLLRLASLASPPRPVDPMDRAVRALAGPTASLPVRTWPLRPERLAFVQAWETGEGDRLLVAKGAPEAVFRLCRLDEAEVERVQAAVEAMARDGLRVLGVASARHHSVLPEEPDTAQFDFAGLVGFLDPVRENVPAALQSARTAGIRVVMITGDHPATALAVARQAGIDTGSGVMTGSEIATLPFPILRERMAVVSVCARIAPEQKLLIVEALRANGEVVAMTGDGVNDAPALEAAHVGIAMGRRGTDIAREAADLVLLDDDFPSLVGGVRMGRRIFANLRKALGYITAIHVPIAGLAILPVLMGIPPLFYPMHVVLLELAIDPTCALVFEGERSARDAMRRPPRPPGEALFGVRQMGLAALQGIVLLGAVMAVYLFALARSPEEGARGLAFLTLIAGNLALALADATGPEGRLTDGHRRIYLLIAIGLGLAVWAALSVPMLQGIFRMRMPATDMVWPALGLALLSGFWLWGAQRLHRAMVRR